MYVTADVSPDTIANRHALDVVGTTLHQLHSSSFIH